MIPYEARSSPFLQCRTDVAYQPSRHAPFSPHPIAFHLWERRHWVVAFALWRLSGCADDDGLIPETEDRYCQSEPGQSRELLRLFFDLLSWETSSIAVFMLWQKSYINPLAAWLSIVE